MIPRGSRAAMWLIGLGALLFAAGSSAHEPHQTILDTATRFMQGEALQAHGPRFDIVVNPGRLDSRLRLRACEDGLEGFMPPGGRTAGNATVGVRCLGPVTWTLYVPVQVEVNGDVLVLSQPLPRGTLLQPAHLRLERHDVSRLSAGYLADAESARDMVLRRALQAGTVLTPQMVEPPRLVQRGQQVVLLAETGSVTVRVEGEAMGDGALGEPIRVRNRSSQQIVEGVVLSRGVVGVSM